MTIFLPAQKPAPGTVVLNPTVVPHLQSLVGDLSNIVGALSSSISSGEIADPATVAGILVDVACVIGKELSGQNLCSGIPLFPSPTGSPPVEPPVTGETAKKATPAPSLIQEIVTSLNNLKKAVLTGIDPPPGDPPILSPSQIAALLACTPDIIPTVECIVSALLK